MKLCLRCNKYFDDKFALCPQDKVGLEYVGKDPLVGALINHRYAVDSVIGKGASGIVYKASRLIMGGKVAVKVLHSCSAMEPASLDKFNREVRALEKLRHPNIVNLWESGVTDDNQPYLVMDYIEGVSLSDVISQTGHLEPGRIVDITRQVCHGLTEAHNQGFVHRDIKPENIVLDRSSSQDFVKLCDFGISYSAFENNLPKSGQPSTVAGSPAYMSPEQCRGIRLTPKSDIYSLALVVFEMFTGRRPVTANSSKEYMLKTVKEKLPLMNEIAPQLGIPEPVDLVVAKALQKNPQDRQESAQHFADDLAKACYGSGFPSIKGSKQNPSNGLENIERRVSER
jgi:serine/threonine-protein kinase